MSLSAATPPRPTADKPADKRAAILAAALRLVARSGLHDAPMSALAREAGVAAGTLYLYFPSKAALINALYLDLLEDWRRATTGAPAGDRGSGRPATDPRDALWQAWHGLARWHLDRPEASNVIAQCRASGILTDATRKAERHLHADGLAQFDDAVARGVVRAMPRPVFYALFAGPIAGLVQMRDAEDLEVDGAVLRTTFDAVCRGLLPPPSAPEA